MFGKKTGDIEDELPESDDWSGIMMEAEAILNDLATDGSCTLRSITRELFLTFKLQRAIKESETAIIPLIRAFKCVRERAFGAFLTTISKTERSLRDFSGEEGLRWREIMFQSTWLG